MSSDIAVNDDLVRFAHKLADRAGEIIRPYFRTALTVTNKNETSFDPVTAADRSAEEAIRELIDQHYPDHGICGEEFADKATDSPLCWVLDPIDGTRAFILGLPIWGTLIGLTYQGTPVLGLMDQPYMKERFWNSKDGAHFRNTDGVEHRIRSRQGVSLAEASLAATMPDMFKQESEQHRFDALSSHVRLTRFGGDCYLYCLLAMGTIDIVAETGLKPFDIAPLIPIIRAAGGIVTTWNGGDPSQGGQILAAGNPTLHEEALKILAG
jgi:myo-inositol-1(or 4)-monophosphatase